MGRRQPDAQGDPPARSVRFQADPPEGVRWPRRVSGRTRARSRNTTMTRLYNWGRTLCAHGPVLRPATPAEAANALQRHRHVTPRGAGRSFGDAAIPNRGGTMLTERLTDAQPMEFDASSGILRANAALPQHAILSNTCPEGWLLPAIPGSRYITLGGMIAADAHGKNHSQTGSIGKYTRSLRVLVADGDLVDCSPEQHPDLFWATIGGLGLTGLVVDVELQLEPLPAGRVVSELVGFGSTDELIEVVEARHRATDFVLGWADGRFSPGRPFAGAVAFGHWRPDLAPPGPLPPFRSLRLPFSNPLPGAGWMAATLLNAVLRRKFRDGRHETADVESFFFPQDRIRNWNIAFGRRGFLEVQCCFPLEHAAAALRDIHGFLCETRTLCSLVALKRFGPGLPDAPLSFPFEGYSIALDMPVRGRIPEALNELDEIIVQHGGRVNPVKDSRLPAERFEQMYPDLERWREVKRGWDPNNVWQSALSRRLHLTE
ncbi:MAG: FAD-binding oxidoreductase [Candidatus Dadabacteria bacterium]|nr:MAG: FAD-binding oxidoreductase [Candidatus Dadabacteria bacterium]